MKINRRKCTNALLVLCGLLITSGISSAQQFVESKDGVNLDDASFPWQLVIDRGKILGCIYDNKYYSLGSILVLESLPRKCEQASDRNGIWQQLSESELALFKQNIEIQQQLVRESTYIGAERINREEARLIRYLRSVKEFADKSQSR
ncbi:DUF1496 domain-containing protein [Thalassotalea euphylliae]|uniref:DUF1496 domain-containing protein n=1 Tax=Thalassotalea euphylliae TaxID=1655234 RepID=A0A3E0TT12_9GAMM|nr:DUF1496 domain-containing protein [Thalassotalea euphylliae]REL27112.1 DUF1496 domain-containing protein [Thalassotalea euphylliae]